MFITCITLRFNSKVKLTGLRARISGEPIIDEGTRVGLGVQEVDYINMIRYPFKISMRPNIGHIDSLPFLSAYTFL